MNFDDTNMGVNCYLNALSQNLVPKIKIILIKKMFIIIMVQV